jgi:uncharacterized protein (TIGR03083 family)
MDRDATFTTVRSLRLALCDQLDGLGEEQWNADSLCAGWRVRDVLGHLVSLQTVPAWKFFVGAFGMRGFHRRANRFAREYGARDPAELLALYREHADGRAGPPFVGPVAPLTDIVTHALDIQRPLGLPPTTDDDSMRLVLHAVCRGLPGFVPKRRVEGLRFEAPDLDWSIGEGLTVRGAGDDILLALLGRSVDDAALEGAGDLWTRR